MNYPHVPSIYGPICQAGFLVSYWIAPSQLWPWKLMLVLAELFVIWLVLRLAKERARVGQETDLPTRRETTAALIAGWCPLPVFETSFNAHPDILGVALILVAMLLRRSGMLSVCAVCCGLAVAAKVFALLLVPFLIGRDVKRWALVLGTLAAAYAPFWLQGSAADLAGLRAFGAEWEFNSSIYALVRSAIGPLSGRLVCGVAFIAIWVVLLGWWYSRARLGVNQMMLAPGGIVFGAFFLLSPTVNPWYLLWVTPFVALNPSFSGVAAMAMVSLSYVTGLNLGDPVLGNFEHPNWVRPIEYGGIALVVAFDCWHGRRGRRTDQKAGLPTQIQT